MPQVIPLWEKESEAHDATLRADMREVADLLLECGADIDARDRVDRTALFSAVADRKMNKKCFEWCLENGADPGAMDVDGMVVFDKGGVDKLWILLLSRVMAVLPPFPAAILQSKFS